MTLAGTGLVAAFAGYKWFDLTKRPDIGYLESNRDLIMALAETIIPGTDTPGAKDANVQDFIIMMVRDCTERKTQNKFIDGLRDLKEYCWFAYEKPYQRCTLAEQTAVLTHFEKQGKPFRGIVGKAQNRFLGRSFFTTLKDYTVEGYCTSEQGATKGLVYDYIPGSFHGCVPVKPGQKAWATN